MMFTQEKDMNLLKSDATAVFKHTEEISLKPHIDGMICLTFMLNFNSAILFSRFTFVEVSFQIKHYMRITRREMDFLYKNK